MNANDIIKFVSEGFEKAKSGAALEVYAAVADFHKRNLLPPKSHYPFGWIIYYALHQSAQYAIKERKLMLVSYLKLSLVKPHKLHSMILTEAIRLYKDATYLASIPGNTNLNSIQETFPSFSIVKFTDLWNLDYLRPGDARRKEIDGNILPSTIEKLITHYVDELYSTHTPPSEKFLRIATRALSENPTSDHLCAQLSRLYELTGNREKAIGMLRNAILASPKFYLWDRLAEMMMGEGSTRLVVSLLYKALQSPGKEDFKGRIHLKMAKIMADNNSFAFAAWELSTVKRIYETNGWNMPRLYRTTERRIPQDTIPVNPISIYKKTESLADDFVYECIPDLAAKKSYHKAANTNPAQKGRATAWRVTTSDGQNYWLQPSRHNIPENLPLNTPLVIKVFGKKVVKASLVISNSLSGR